MVKKRTPRSHCRRGHPLEGENLNPTRLKRGKRECLSCVRAIRVVRSSPNLSDDDIQNISNDFYEETIRETSVDINKDPAQEVLDIESDINTESSKERSPISAPVGQIEGLIPVSVPGASDPVMAIQKDGKIWVSARHLCESIGIDWSSQHRKLSDRDWATIELLTMVGSDGRARDMSMVDRRTLTMWLATIHPTKVMPETRDSLKAYQMEASETLDGYFHEGGAINPRATESQLDELSSTIDISRRQLEILELARRMLPESHIEARAEIAVARAFGETPQINPTSVPIYVQDFLKSKGMTRRDIGTNDSSFGGKLSIAFFKKYGKKPEKFPQATRDGSIRNINAYTEKDRPLMEQVWQEYIVPKGLKNSKGEILN